MVWGQAGIPSSSTSGADFLAGNGVPDCSNNYCSTGAAGVGGSLASGDFDADGYPDLLVGAPDANVSAASDAGSVLLLRGAAGGYTTSGFQYWDAEKRNVSGGAESYDHFGFSLSN